MPFRLEKIIVSSSDDFTNKAISCGMLGTSEKRGRTEGSAFIVHGLEKRDANVKDIEIDGSWVTKENTEICGFALASQLEVYIPRSKSRMSISSYISYTLHVNTNVP